MVHEAVPHRRTRQRLAENAPRREGIDDVAQRPAERDAQPGRGRLHGAPGAERQARTGSGPVGERHGAGERAHGEQACAQTDQGRADAQQRRRDERPGHHHA